MSRRCVRCPTSRMPDDVRHLHELPAGASFRFAGTEAQLQLVEVTPASCKVATAPTIEHKIIRPRFGAVREFDVTVTGVRRCAPSAMVETA